MKMNINVLLPFVICLISGSLSASEPDLTKNYLFEKLHNGKTPPRATMENTTISTARRLLALKGSPAVSDDQGTQVKIKLPDAIHSSTTEMKKASTTTQTTTESSTIEITSETTIESTTEETTTSESTTLETTEETTTESTTVETTESTTMETTEATTIETTLETTASETLMKPTSKSLLKTNSPNVPDQTENVNTTKSWQKYLSKSTPKPMHSTQSPVKDPKSLSNKPLFSKLIPNPSTSLTGIKSVNKDPKQTVDKNSTPRTTDKKSTPSNIVFQNKSQKEDATEINIRAPSTNQETTATTPSSNNSSVNISIDVDIDVNLRSHYTSASPNTSAEYISYDPDGTESPKDREKRYENKRIVAGVILVVLVSLSAGCALLLVIMPSNYDVVSRKYRTRPDQVALIPPRNRCRPRFYDSSLYMGH